MNARELYDLAPYGALIRFSNNEPQPPAHHKRKLADWKYKNSTAFFTHKRPARSFGPEFALTQFGMIQFTHCYGVTGSTTFEIERMPAEGTILVRSKYAAERGDVELDGICADEAEAVRRFGRSTALFWRVEGGKLVEFQLAGKEVAYG